MILIGRHRRELRLGEGEGLEHGAVLVVVIDVEVIVVASFEYHVQSGLITVHRVENNVAVVVQLMIGQLQLVEADHLLHPMRSRGRRIRVNVHPGRRKRICLAGDHPIR